MHNPFMCSQLGGEVEASINWGYAKKQLEAVTVITTTLVLLAISPSIDVVYS